MRVISRKEWGSKYASAYRNYNAPLPAENVWLHHSVTIAPNLIPPFDDDYAAIRSLERIGQQRFGWGISYSFPITPAGLVFEGHRINGVGTHTANRNSKDRAICFVGNYEVNNPTMVQEWNTAALLIHGQRAGYWKRAQLAGGHRDLKSTSCPGIRAYRRIPAINSTVRNILMADSSFVQDIGWRVHSFLQGSEKKLAPGGKETSENLPMVTHLVAMIWRVEALVKGRERVIGGPTEGEPIELVAQLNQFESKIDQLTDKINELMSR